MDLKDNNIKPKKFRNSYANVLSSKSPLPKLLKEVKELRAKRTAATANNGSGSATEGKQKKREKGPRKYYWSHEAFQL